MIKLQYYRKLNNMYQKELAEKLSVSPSTISQWEIGNNEPDIKNLIKLASIFDISLDSLLGNETNAYKRNSRTISKLMSETLTKEQEERVIEYIDFIIHGSSL